MKKISYKAMVPFIISLALFMESLDTTIINTAIPAMSRSLHVNPINLKIALISYLLSLAVFIPISGWMADKFGIKRVFVAAIGIFTLSSFWCGYTNNLWELVIARSLQGLGGSHMLPLGRLFIVRTFARHELINTMTRIVLVAAMGMMLGPVLGGVITDYISWRWIFWVNIPVGLVTILLAMSWLKESEPEEVQPLDKLGFLLFGTGLSTLTFSLSAFSETTIDHKVSISILLISFFLLAAYFIRSRKQRYPIVNMKLFGYRTFRVSVIGNLVSRLGFGGVPFLVPLLLQVVFGYSPMLSGFLLAPTALGVLLVKPFSLYLLRLFGYKKLLILNTVLVGCSIWIFSTIGPETPIYVIALFTFFFGFLMSLQFSGMNSLAFAELPQKILSSATSIISTAQQLAQSFGVAVAAILIGYFTPSSSISYILNLEVFHYTFIVMSIITLLSTLIFTRLRPEDGDVMLKVDESVISTKGEI